MDYTAMETSSTTDPKQLITTVKEKFGKMQRAAPSGLGRDRDGRRHRGAERANQRSPCDVEISQWIAVHTTAHEGEI